MTTLWVGTYPAEGLGAPVGHGEGVWRVSLEGGQLLGPSQRTTQAAPSFVAGHPALPLLYAVEEAESDGPERACGRCCGCRGGGRSRRTRGCVWVPCVSSLLTPRPSTCATTARGSSGGRA